MSYGVISWREGNRFRIVRAKTESEYYDTLFRVMFDTSGQISLIRAVILPQ
jgi:hypothetical protein